MKAEELRIGNWIMDVIGAYKKVNANHILHASNNPDNSYTPIPIQPSILEKAGFEYGGHFYSKVFMNEDTSSPSRITYCYGLIEISRSGICAANVHCKYVHQLQNLYLSLTGSELPLNL